MRPRRLAPLPTLLIALLAPPAAAATAPLGDEAAREAEIGSVIAFLASPELEGRDAAERGGAVASAFIASRLQAAGWLPAGDAGPSGASYFQAVRAVAATYDAGASSLEIAWRDAAASGVAGPRRASRAPGRERRLRLLGGDEACAPSGRDSGGAARFYHAADRVDSIEVSGEILHAGFGIRAPEHGHDDYAGLDVRGKIVLVFSGEPGEDDPDSPWNGRQPTRHLPVSSKRALAESLGAAALLVVPNPDGPARSARDLTRAGLPPGDAHLDLAGATSGIPVVALDREALPFGVAPPPGARATLRLAYRDRRELTLRNVLARRGAGRGLEGDAVLVGAHWDHLGLAGGTLHPGADDNASGVAALLAAAAELAARPPRGDREVIFASWTGEERGRLGSRWYVEHPILPLSRLAAVVNLDGLGRDNLDRDDYANVLQVIYSAGAPVLRDLAGQANDVGFDLRFHGGFRFRPVSDHASFFDAGVPFVYPFSGYGTDYHTPGDTPERVRLTRVARAARYVARLARLLAEHPGAIRIDPAIRDAPPPDPFERPYARP